MLHSSLWRHGASDLRLPALICSPGGDRELKASDGQVLDFLYPEKTLALIRRISKHNVDATEFRCGHQLRRGGVRHFSTSQWQAQQHDTDFPALTDVHLQKEMEERLEGSSASDALESLLASEQSGMQELAWHLYLAIPEDSRTAPLRADLLDYLSLDPSVDANRILDIFKSLPTEERRASSYRDAITAYLALDMVDPAVQLQEEAAFGYVGMYFGSNLVLARAVQDNQWDLSLRILRTFVQFMSRAKSVDMSRAWIPHPKATGYKAVWKTVSQLPYLRGNLDSARLHIQQFQAELLSTEEDKDVVRFFIHGLATEATKQILRTDSPDEDMIWDFFTGFFRELHALGLSSPYLYEHVILEMMSIPRYREHTNQRKIYLELYRMYREECEENPDPLVRPSVNLLARCVVHVGKVGSTFGVENLIKDFRTFYPGQPMPYRTLKYLTDYYADLGAADQVHEYFEEMRKAYESQIDLKNLTALPYVYARRVDVEGTEKQFRRISDEFGLTPDITIWNVLLLVYTRADDLDRALACFNQILESGLTPDVRTFGSLLDLCASRGDVEAYEALYTKAEQLKIHIRSDVRARAGYVQTLLNFDDPEGAYKIARIMVRDQHAGTLRGSLTHTWNLLIQYYALRADINECRRLYREMVEEKIPLNTWTYGSLMRAFVEVRQTNAAYKILRVTMPENNIQVHAFHYAIVITGFIRERQYDHALRANKRMMARNVPQTVSSRVASLNAVGISEILKLKKEKDHDPRTRLIGIEEQMRGILLSDYETDVALRQPRHLQMIDSKYHSSPEDYFGFLIILYGTRGAFEYCKEMFQAAAIARQDEANYEAPISLLTAIMEASLRAKDHDEVARCWELALTQANKLVRTLHQAVNPEPPKPEISSLTDPAIRDSHVTAPIAVNRRQVLFRATRIYIRSLLAREDNEALADAQTAIGSLLASGFVVDNLTWNEFIQMLARRGHLIDSYTACEAYLMPNFPGWRNLNPQYVRKDRPGHMWMELRHEDLRKRMLLPRYKTLVILATAYAQVRRDEAEGLGYNQEMGGWMREILQRVSPMTVEAIETMPRTGDNLQRRYLSQML